MLDENELFSARSEVWYYFNDKKKRYSIDSEMQIIMSVCGEGVCLWLRVSKLKVVGFEKERKKQEGNFSF